jgi:hypothetical protein
MQLEIEGGVVVEETFFVGVVFFGGITKFDWQKNDQSTYFLRVEKF